MRWGCQDCGSVYEENLPMCCACFGRSMWPLPENGRVRWESSRRGIRKSSELRPPKGSHLKWKELGLLPDRWKMLLYGAPGAGKSTFATLLADEFKNSLYIAHEEGEDALASRVERLEIVRVCFSDASRYPEIVNDVESMGSVDLLALDSVTSLDLGVEKFSLLCGMAKRIVAIAQITKDGKFSGSQSYAHYCDMVLGVEGFRVNVIKNRFSGLCSFPVFGE